MDKGRILEGSDPTLPLPLLCTVQFRCLPAPSSLQPRGKCGKILQRSCRRSSWQIRTAAGEALERSGMISGVQKPCQTA